MKVDHQQEEKIIAWLAENVGFESFQNAVDRGLDYYRKLFFDFVPLKKSKIIIVGGTNGKGETVHYLRKFLELNQKSYTAWTSPHIVSILERFGSSKGSLSYEAFEKYREQALAILANRKIQLSYYEFLFFIFCLWSEEQAPEYIILEVGLGGRLDATNLYDAEIALICSISRDHCEFLGETYQKILKEKYGIARPGKQLITSLELEYLQNLVEQWAAHDGVVHSDLFREQKLKKQNSFTERNHQLAKTCAASLGLKQLSMAVEQKPLRLVEKQFGMAQITLCGSHNPDGLRKQLDYFKTHGQDFDIYLVAFSKRKLADITQMLASLLAYTNKFSKIYLTSFANWKAVPLGELERICALKFSARVEVCSNWKERLNIEQAKKQNILVTGSYYFMGDVLKHLDSTMFTGP